MMYHIICNNCDTHERVQDKVVLKSVVLFTVSTKQRLAVEKEG